MFLWFIGAIITWSMISFILWLVFTEYGNLFTNRWDKLFYSYNHTLMWVTFFVFPVKNVAYRKVGWTCSVANFYAPKILIQNQILNFDLGWHDLCTNSWLLEFHFFCRLATLCEYNDVIFLTRHTWGQDSLEFYEEGADLRNAFTE